MTLIDRRVERDDPIAAPAVPELPDELPPSPDRPDTPVVEDDDGDVA